MDRMDEERVKMTYEAAVYREQLNLLRKEMERISLSTLDLSNAARSVEELELKNTLIPIGGSAYVRAKITDTKVIVPIGGEYALEMTKEEALKELKARAESTKEAVIKLNDEFEKINDKLRHIAAQLEEAERMSKLSSRVEEGVKEDYI